MTQQIKIIINMIKTKLHVLFNMFIVYLLYMEETQSQVKWL